METVRERTANLLSPAKNLAGIFDEFGKADEEEKKTIAAAVGNFDSGRLVRRNAEKLLLAAELTDEIFKTYRVRPDDRRKVLDALR